MESLGFSLGKKILFRFFCKMLWKKLNEHFGQPSSRMSSVGSDGFTFFLTNLDVFYLFIFSCLMLWSGLLILHCIKMVLEDIFVLLLILEEKFSAFHH